MSNITRKTLTTVYNFFKKGGSQEQAPLRKSLELGEHVAIFSQLSPSKAKEGNLSFLKENWIVQNNTDPDRFNHFLAHLYHPDKREAKLPALLLFPGMLCNGNLFRLVPDKGNFRNLDISSSFANKLADAGFNVIIANPRYCQWIYTRYVHEKLGIKNYFSDATDMDRMVGDLAFYIDAAKHIGKTNSVAVLGFSFGGILLMHYLATRKISPDLSHAIFLGTPTTFSNDQSLIMLFSIYNTFAKFAPIRRYSVLEFLARNLLPVKYLLKKLSPQLLSSLPLSRELFNPEFVNPELILPFISYVLEPMPSPVIEYMINSAANKKFVGQDGKVEIIPNLTRWEGPSLIVGGTQDGLVSQKSGEILFKSLGGVKKQLAIIDKVGHLDMIGGKKLNETADICIKAIKREIY